MRRILPSHTSTSRRAMVAVLATSATILVGLSQLRAAPLYLEIGGRVVIEAEHFASRTPSADGHHWHIAPDEDTYGPPADLPPTIHPNARGSQITLIPDNGFNHNTTANWNTAPWVDYTFRLETTGLYRLWLRWRGWDGNSDSLYAQLWKNGVPVTDGTGGAIADWYGYHGNSGSGFNSNWRGQAVPEVVNASGTLVDATWQIDTPGDYMIRITHREDGCALDTICLQLASLGTSISDPGPAESPILTDGPFVFARTPGVNAGNVNPYTAYQVQIRDGATLALNTEDPVLELNGTPLAFTKSKNGAITTLAAPSSGMLARASTNTVTLIYKDSANTSYTNIWEFFASAWTELPASFKMAAGTVSTLPGFTLNAHQAQQYDSTPSPITTGLGSSIDRAEGQIRAYLLNPATGQPYANNFQNSENLVFGDGMEEAFGVVPETYINWNYTPLSASGADVGNFRTDNTAPNGYGFPDIYPPAYYGRLDGGFTVNWAYEIITYLDLPVGLIRLGVNSDDGFQVSCGYDYRERYDTNRVIVLGQFDGGRGAADSQFDVMVAEAGIYPIRLLWFQNTGSASLEFFHVKPDGTRIPINDVAFPATWQTGNPEAIKAYRSATLTRGGVVDWLSPAPNAINVSTGAVLRVQLADGPNGTVNAGSIKLYLNEAEVTATTSNDAGRTRLAYQPPAPLPFNTTNIARVEFTDTLGRSVTQAWQFVTGAEPIAAAPGELTRKIWTGLTGVASIPAFLAWADFTNNVNYNTAGEPAVITAYETAQSVPATDNYGQHVIGYINPKVSDWYIFYTASDDHSEVWLSTNDLPQGQQMITFMRSSSGFREFTTGRYIYNRRSLPIYLEAGKRYFTQAYHYDGTGGDHFSVTWWRTNDPAIVNGSLPISGDVLEKFVGAAFTRHPASVTLAKGRPVNLIAQAVIGVGTVTVQWLKGPLNGTPTTPVPGATGYTLSFDPSQVSDTGSYKLRITVDGVPYDSQVANVLVIDDSAIPVVKKAYGMNDAVLGSNFVASAYTIGIEFNEQISSLSLNSAGLAISGGNYAIERNLSADNRAVLLKVQNPLPANFTVDVSGLSDLAGNALPTGTSLNVTLAPLAPQILGTPGTDPANTSGTVAYALDDGYQVTAGGSDIWDTTDAGHFLYQSWSGNFDAAVRVESLSLADVWSKAGIMAREDLTEGSRNVMVLVAPTNGQNVYNVQWRDAANVAAASKAGGERIYGVTYPDAWLRLTREGQVFKAYMKTNGVDWHHYHTYTAPAPLPDALYVGLATTSHDNTTDLTTAVYRQFSIRELVAGAPEISGFALAQDGALKLTISGVLGQSYRLLGSTDIALPLAQWAVVTSGTITSVPQTIDAGPPTGLQRFFRIASP